MFSKKPRDLLFPYKLDIIAQRSKTPNKSIKNYGKKGKLRFHEADDC